MAAESRAAELRREIAYHDHRYHVLGDPLIGDDEYDALPDELCALEREHPELATPGSPTSGSAARRVAQEGWALRLEAVSPREARWHFDTSRSLRWIRVAPSEAGRLMPCSSSLEVDLVVIGSHRWGPVGRMLLGSPREALRPDATCPVLLVRPSA